MSRALFSFNSASLTACVIRHIMSLNARGTTSFLAIPTNIVLLKELKPPSKGAI